MHRYQKCIMREEFIWAYLSSTYVYLFKFSGEIRCCETLEFEGDKVNRERELWPMCTSLEIQVTDSKLEDPRCRDI